MEIVSKKGILPSALVLAFALGACSSKSGSYASNTEASPVLRTAEEKLQAAQASQVDVFAPKSYEAAKDSLESAKEKRSSNAKNEEILAQIDKTNSLIDTAVRKSELSKAALVGVADTRMAAINFKAHESKAEAFKEADERLADFSEDVESGNVKGAQKVSKRLNDSYRTLMVDGALAMYLGSATKVLNSAKDEGAKDNAPVTMAEANKYYNQAVTLIKQDPNNTAVVDQAAQRADFEAAKLLRVTRKAKASGGAKAEPVILQAEAQTQFIYEQNATLSRVRTEKKQVENKAADLQLVKDLQDKVAAIDSKFTKNEADVYQQDKTVIVRLKSVKFAKNKAEIPTASFETLKKLQEAIKVFDNPRIRVEGHTDATGVATVNMPLSQKRAEAVKQYLTANLSLSADSVEAEGYGSARPITTNKTPIGRAQNRRIDVVIQE